MKQRIKITESKLKSLIRQEINEAIKNARPNNVRFGIDKITEWTLKNDICINEGVSQDDRWILKKKNWEINNYDRFIQIIKNTPQQKKGFLTFHGIEELSTPEWITYTLKGHDVAFALHFIEPGKVDICNLVNNSDLRGIAHTVLTFAKMEGGTQMDNYRGVNGDHGFLGNTYRNAGFDRQTWHDEFNPEFQPEDPEWQFDTETYGTPDVEGLESSKHRRRYDTNPRYREKFDKRMNNKFK